MSPSPQPPDARPRRAHPRRGHPAPIVVFAPVTAPSGRPWVMGDARGHSDGSRTHVDDPHEATVAVSDVVGVVRSEQ